MSQPPQSPPDLGLHAESVPTRGGLPPRRLVDLLRVEPGHRIGFLDDPAGRGAQLAGEMLGRQSRVFLYGVNVGAGPSMPTYDDECFDLVVSAGEGKHWTLVSRALADVNRLVRPGGTVALVTPHPLSLLGRGLRRVARARMPAVRSRVSGSGTSGPYGSSGSYGSAAAADPHDAQDIAVGKRLVELFGSAVRTELGPRVVWHVTREMPH